MLQVNTSFLVRGERVTEFLTLPVPHNENLIDALKRVAWVAEQKAPKVEINESKLQNFRG